MALRRLDDTARSGTVSLKDGRVDEFHESGTGGPGLVNAGVYVMRRETVALREVFDLNTLRVQRLPIAVRVSYLVIE